MEFNLTYMHRAGEKYGIYTLLDTHQDVLSGKFCGEGVPDWAVETGSKQAGWCGGAQTQALAGEI